jgi:sulfoxide reductase heme-binding subunit YedZ
MRVDQRYRFIYKPLTFTVSMLPLLWLALGAFGLLGVDLGADPVKKMLHTCGKTTLNFLMLTLMVTPVRQLAGLPQLIRLRRMLGLFAFFYALLHFTVYFVLDQERNFASVLADIAKRPYITVGFTALVLLIPLALTSTQRMMRRLGRRWQKLHRLVYLIATLGVVHYYWQVKRDVREPLIYAGMLAALLAYRYAKRRRPTTSKSVSSTTPERI